jgi:hypothetical protein
MFGVLISAALTACGRSSDPADASNVGSDIDPPVVDTCPDGGNLTTIAELLSDLLPDEQTLEMWQRRRAEPGPRLPLRGFALFRLAVLHSLERQSAFLRERALPDKITQRLSYHRIIQR